MRGASARAVRPIPKGSLPAGGGHVRWSQQIVLPWDNMTESGRGGAPYSSQGGLSSVGRAAALQAAGHRFESDRFHPTSFLVRMITRQISDVSWKPWTNVC